MSESEYLRSFNSDNSDDHERLAEAEHFSRLDPTEQPPLEYHPVLQEATRVQQLLDAQIYHSQDRLYQSTRSMTRLLNQAAGKANLIDQSVAMVDSNPAKATSPDLAAAIAEGRFLGFIISANETLNPYDDSDDPDMVYQPQLQYQVETPFSQAGWQFQLGDVASSSLIFTQSQPPVELPISRWSSPIEKIAIEHFNLFGQELSQPLSAKSLQKAAAIGFYLLNKGAYAGQVEFEDRLIDLANLHLPLNQTYNLEADFCLATSHHQGQLNYHFIDKPGQPISLLEAPIQTVSSLPRSYRRSTRYGQEEIILNNQQKSLYLTIMSGDRTYHVPFESLRQISPSRCSD